MNKIYEKALRVARQRVFDDEARYTPIIVFCKKKLADKWYWQHQRAWERQNWGLMN